MSERSNISTIAFDGEAAWAVLPAHVQARIGAFAIELGVAMAISEHADYPAQRAGEQASEHAAQLLREAVVGYDGVPEISWWEGDLGAPGTFRIPSCLPVCRECGCSHNDPCDDGCGWHSDGLCTACAEGKSYAGVEDEPVFPARTFTLTPLPEGWIYRNGELVRDEAAAPLQPGDVVVGGVTQHEPPLPKEEARAIVKGACKAVNASPLAQPVQPLGGALRELAKAIDTMHAEIEGESHA